MKLTGGGHEQYGSRREGTQLAAGKVGRASYNSGGGNPAGPDAERINEGSILEQVRPMTTGNEQPSRDQPIKVLAFVLADGAEHCLTKT